MSLHKKLIIFKTIFLKKRQEILCKNEKLSGFLWISDAILIKFFLNYLLNW